ncbi:MAG TPA: MFS transporter [Acidimicrobiia bacterium]|nr:MFS transporter [Acidimicrobiia bacterium]
MTETDEPLDPRRWFAASVAILSVAIPVLDNTILNLAVPTILREFHTQLSSLQWVITGYSLTLATLLIIGGRLGDIFGHRRMFVIGATIFGVGSLLASISTSVPTLFVGEALIEGIGASMMIPATLSILSNTFQGAERPKAFAAWGAVAGASVAFGPIVGGFLTTQYSWRWAFRINVIVAPIIVIGGLLFMKPDVRGARRPHIDVRGAALIALGSFSLIFGLSEGTTYGWWKPIKDLTIGTWRVWPGSRAVSIIPFAFALALLVFVAFVFIERAMERGDRDPLFEFGQLRHLGFRYGLLTTMVLAMGQFGLLFILPVLLQNGRHLSALRTGEWMLPQGILIAVSAPIGGRLTRRFSITSIVRWGLALEAVGLLLVALAIAPHVSFLALVPGMIVFGLGVGFASSQLTNVILSDIDREKAGVAGGVNTTVRQVGLALGIATFASFIDASTRTGGTPTAVANGARPAMYFAAGVVAVGAALSLLIPRVTVATNSVAEEVVSAFESIDVA